MSDFISVWRTTANGESITIPVYNGGTYNCVVQWGDGTNDTITTWNDPKWTHAYAALGYHTVTITGTITGFRFNNGGDKLKLYDITQCGTLNVGNATNYFYGCENLVWTAVDALDTTGMTTLVLMFGGCTHFNGAVGNWNVSNITDMRYVFYLCPAFNKDVSSWNTGNVVDIRAMFYGATIFNQDISSWNTSKVVSIYEMFYNASAFNANIGGWDVSKVTTMRDMFHNATSFNQDLHLWNVSAVGTTGFSSMFNGATSFNGSVSGWVIKSTVTTFITMFYGCSSFNQPVNWDTTAVTTLSCDSMFYGCTILNSAVTFSTANVTNMTQMFYHAYAFNQNIGGWNTGKVTTMLNMFNTATAFNQNLGTWNVTALTTAAGMFVGVTLSTVNYDLLLNGWAAQAVQNNVVFNGGSSKYSVINGGQASRLHLTGTHTWTITDGGLGSGAGTLSLTDSVTVTDSDLEEQGFGKTLSLSDTVHVTDSISFLHGCDIHSIQISYGSGTDIICLHKPYPSNADGNLNFNNTNMSFRSGHYASYVDEINDEGITITGYENSLAMAKLVTLGQLADNGTEITLSNLSSQYDGTYVISSMTYRPIGLNVLEYSITLKFVR